MKGVAISGKAGAGKTTLANLIVARLRGHGLLAEKVGFADHLKTLVWERHGITKNDEGGRDLLIDTAVQLRAEDPLIFVKVLEDKLYQLERMDVVAVVDDVRYPNELQMLEEHGFLTVRVETPPEDRLIRLRECGADATVVYSSSASETALDREVFERVVFNKVEGGECLQCVACGIAHTVWASAS